METPSSITGYIDLQWCAIFDGSRVTIGVSSGFEYPPGVIEEVLKGREVGDVMDEVTGISNLGEKTGAVSHLTHGYMGDTKVNGTEWDFHSYAPSGVPMDYPPLIVYLTAFIYKLANLFASVPLLVVCFWLPAFVGPLAGVVAYFFVRRYTNNYGAAFAGILAVTAPLYFIRTVPGWFDTDMFNVFFPLLVT